MIAASIRRPVTVTMVSLGLTVFGMISYTRLPLDLLPDISYPTLTVRCEFPGTSSREVENLISRPLEELLGVSAGLKSILSISRPGQSELILQFDWSQSMDLKLMEVREKLDRFQEPEAADPPQLIRYDPRDDPVMRLAMSGRDPKDLYREAELLKRDLEPLPGIAKVSLAGIEEPEILVEVDDQEARRYGLTLQQIEQRIRSENVNAASGILETEGGDYVLRVVQEFSDPRHIEALEIPLAGGKSMRLGQVVRSRIEPREAKSLTRLDGKPCVELAIYREGDSNAVEVARVIRRRLEALGTRKGVDFSTRVIFDQSVYIQAAIREVIENAVQGGVLSILLLAIFLDRLSLSLLVALSIPLSILGTFVIMHALGVGANIMSLGGLALGAGIMVDNSIVVVETIARRCDEGQSPSEAVLAGAEEVAGAVIASTLTAVVVFLPAVFLSGLAGQVFKDLSITVSASLAISLVVALVVIPCAARPLIVPATKVAGDLTATPRQARVLAPLRALLRMLVLIPALILGLIKRGIWPFVQFCRSAMTRTELVYERLLDRGLRYPWLYPFLVTVVTLASLWLVPSLRVDLFPELRRGEFDVVVLFPQGTALDSTLRGLELLESRLRKMKEIESIFLKAGQGREENRAEETEEGENAGVLHVVLQPAELIREDELITAVGDEARRLQGAEVRIRRSLPFTLEPPIQVLVQGQDLMSMSRTSNQIVEILEKIGTMTDITSSLEFGSPEITVTFDRVAMARMGLDQDQIVQGLTRRLQGMVAGRITREGKSMDIRVRGDRDRAVLISELGHLVVQEIEGRPLHLSAIARIEAGLGPTAIRRLDQERVIAVRARVGKGSTADTASAVADALSRLAVPPDLRVDLGGRTREMEESAGELIGAFLLALFLIYCVMASQFESYLSPFLVMFSVPLAGCGVILAMWWWDTAVSVVSVMGIIFLAGIAVNNAIVLVDAMAQEAQTKELFAAILYASRTRFRPILMTSLTTLLGVLPMIGGAGGGAELSEPMAVTILGGQASTTFLTLFLIPALYWIVHRGKSTPPPLAGAKP